MRAKLRYCVFNSNFLVEQNLDETVFHSEGMNLTILPSAMGK